LDIGLDGVSMIVHMSLVAHSVPSVSFFSLHGIAKREIIGYYEEAEAHGKRAKRMRIFMRLAV